MPKVPAAYVKARSFEILLAAARCFARSGYRKTSMADIAREADLSVGALYRYFDSKERLFQSLAQNARENTTALWERVGTAEGAVAPLRAFVERYFRMMEDPDCRSSLALDIRLRGEALDSEVVRHELRTAYETQVRQIAKHLSEARARTGKRREAISMARALVGLLNEAGVQALLIPDFDIPAYRGTVLRLIDAWMEGKPPRK